MRVVVTGAGGMLGTDVVRVAQAEGHEVIALDRAALDVTRGDDAAQAIADEQPDAVVNCAAYTDVDGAEDDLRAAMDANADGAAAVARGAAAAGASVVYPSTDYVFDGSKRAPYVESDPPRPQSVYGQSKLAGEHATAASNPRHQIVRSAWLFGLAGRNFVDTMLRLGGEHGEVSVVRDQRGSPTYTGHLAEAIVRLLDGGGYGVHHLTGGGDCTWYDLALESFEQAGVRCRVLAATTADLARPAPRPAYSVLGTERPDAPVLPDWRVGVADYLRARGAAA